MSDSEISESLLSNLRDDDFEVCAIQSTANDFAQLTAAAPDLLVLDYSHAEEAMDLVRRVGETSELNKTLLLVVAEWGSGQAALGLSHGADAFEPKPIDATRLIATVNRLLRPRLVMAANASDE